MIQDTVSMHSMSKQQTAKDRTHSSKKSGEQVPHASAKRYDLAIAAPNEHPPLLAPMISPLASGFWRSRLKNGTTYGRAGTSQDHKQDPRQANLK